MTDTEWNELRHEWAQGTGETASAARARTEARRRGRAQLLWLAAQIVVYATLAGLVTGWALHTPRPVAIVAAGATWLFVLAGLGGELVARRGLWRTAASSTRDFLDITARRCRARLRLLRLGTFLLLAQILFFVPWIAWVLAEREPSATPVDALLAYGWLALFGGGYLLYRWRAAARIRRELEGTEGLLRALRHVDAGEDDDSPL